MENYDTEINYGIHTVKATIQYKHIKADIFTNIGGNMHGVEILNRSFDFEEMDAGTIEKLITSGNLHIEFDEESDMFHLELMDDSEEHILDLGGAELNSIIVSLEIVEYVEK